LLLEKGGAVVRGESEMKRLAATAVLLALLGAATRAAASCKDPNLPVGAQCHKYGEDWDASAGFFSSLGIVGWLSARTLSYPTGFSSMFDGNVESSPLAYHFPASSLASSSLRSYGGETGVAWFPFPYLYLGAAGAYGGGSLSFRSFSSNGLTITPGTGLNVSDTVFGGILGVRLPLGTVSLRADALVGGAWYSIDQYAQSGTSQLTSSGSASALFVEPRVHVDLWLSPFFTLGLFASMPDVSPEATNVGITFAAHTTAFDKRFAAF